MNAITQAYTKPWNATNLASQTNDVWRAAPVSILPYRMQISTQLIAVYPRTANEAPIVDQFIGNITAMYPALNLSAIGGGVLAPFLAQAGLSSWTIPSLQSVIKRFDSESALQSYIKDASYAFDNSVPLIYAAIAFNNWAPSSGVYDYRRVGGLGPPFCPVGEPEPAVPPAASA